MSNQLPAVLTSLAFGVALVAASPALAQKKPNVLMLTRVQYDVKRTPA
jgi:hypothetical protein